MNVTGPLIALIAADTTANGLLAGRVYPGVLKQTSTYPAAAINITGVYPFNTKTGASDLDSVLIQIDTYGTTFSSAAAADEAIRGALDYKSSGALDHIEYQRTIDGLSEKPELIRMLSEYTIMLRR